MPIKASHNHCDWLKFIQTIGTNRLDIMAPTTPVIKRVNNGLSTV